MIDNLRCNINKPVIMMSNLSFDHPLSNIELFDLQNLLIQGIPIGQIYFKDDVDIDTIEKVKLLLEGLPSVNDSLTEKYIMKDINDNEKDLLINMNFINIDSWNISYSKEGNKYSITSLSKFRKIEEWFKSTLYELDNNNLSLLDKICFLYDKVKMMEFDTNKKYDRLPEIIEDGRATAYGYNLLFQKLLSSYKIPSIIEKVSDGNEASFVTLAVVNDEKYDVNGIYLFDPSMDTIFKNQYKNNLARKMNYNFFAITIEQIKKVYAKRTMCGCLRILASDDTQEFEHSMNLYEVKNGIDCISKIEKVLNISFKDLYNKINNTTEISKNDMISIITKSLEKYPNDMVNKELLAKTMENNYHTRNNEIFTNEYVKKMHKIDI